MEYKLSIKRIKVQKFVSVIITFPLFFCARIFFTYIVKYKFENLKNIHQQYKEVSDRNVPFVICANHLTFIDSCLFLYYFGSPFWYQRNNRCSMWNLLAIQYHKNLFFRFIGFIGKCVFVDRKGSVKHHAKIIEIAKYLLHRKEVITIFPEGTRSKTGRFNSAILKSGVAKIIQEVENCHVLCVYLRSHKQKQSSVFPEKNSHFYCDLKFFKPEYVGESKSSERRSILKQIGNTITQQEEKYFKARRKTVLITGASRGIGSAFAKVFAENNYDLVLLGRDTQNLNVLKQTVLKKYLLNVSIIEADLSKHNAVRYIKETLQSQKIKIHTLVNNAGFGVQGEFQHSSEEAEKSMIMLQTVSTIELTKYVLQNMTEQNDGAVLNVGSVYSFMPVPYQSVYGACKAFLHSFSNSLRYEVQSSNIKVTSFCPGATDTEFHKTPKKLFKGMSADDVAKYGYNALINGKSLAIPGFSNRFLVLLCHFIPNKILAILLSRINHMRGIHSTHT